jgi:DNA-directed RNA polymerase I subunit RPA1
MSNEFVVVSSSWLRDTQHNNAMTHKRPILPFEIVGAAFGFYTADEIRKISVKRIWNPQTYDHLNAPNKGGLYDPALGPLDKTYGK